MAGSWGSSRNSIRIGVFYDSIQVSADKSQARITNARILIDRGVYIEDISNTLSWSGGAVTNSSKSGVSLTGSGQKTIADTGDIGETWVDLVYGATNSETFAASLSGVEYAGATLTASTTIKYPARPYERPAAATSLAMTGSGSSRTLTWDFTSTSSAPVERSNVRQRKDGGAWETIASVAAPTKTYTVSGLAADSKYEFAIETSNSTGWSAGTAPVTAATYTTPAAPTSATAAKQADGSIVVAWVDQSAWESSWEIEDSADGTTWVQVGTPTAGSPWTHVGPSTAVTHRYRVRAVAPGPLVSAWSATSNTVTLIAPPNAPTSLQPAGVFDAAEAQSFMWQHNPVDTTPQSAYELQSRYSTDGGTTWTSWATTGKIASVVASRPVAASTFPQGARVQWQVRTWGQHPDPSVWSAVAGPVTSARPIPTIQTPDGVTDVTQAALTVTWTYYDAESTAQAEARVVLYDAAGDQLDAGSVAGAGTSFSFVRQLENLTGYRVTVEVRDGSGLWSEPAVVDFATDFLPPATPIVAAAFDEVSGAVQISIMNEAGGAVETDHNQVWRSIDGGPYELVADLVPPGATITDWTPATKGTNDYRVTAWSATPTSADSAVATVVTDSCWLYLNGGPEWSQVARLRGEPSVGLTVGRRKVLHQFAGRTQPVEYTGQARMRVYRLSGKVAGHAGARADMWGTWAAWEQLADLPAPLVYRDPLGRREFVSVGSDVQIVHSPGGRWADITATLTVVDP